jgi:hypothetical protein
MDELNIEEFSFNNSSTEVSNSANDMSTSSRVSTQPSVTKYKETQKHSKSSWVWKYFITDKDRKYDVCQVPIYFEVKVLCGKKFSHDGSTGNMGNHLRTKHNIYERTDEVKHYLYKIKYSETISINNKVLFISFNNTKGTK